MTHDLLVFKKCRKCKTLNEFELNNIEHSPFDMNNSEQWVLLHEVFRQEIRDATNYCYELHPNASNAEMRAFVVAQLKLNDIAFCECEHCHKTLMLYIISV